MFQITVVRETKSLAIRKIFDFRTTCGDRNRSKTALSVKVVLEALSKNEEAGSLWDVNVDVDVDIDVDVTPRQIHKTVLIRIQ
jgi:hypothetical protein